MKSVIYGIFMALLLAGCSASEDDYSSVLESGDVVDETPRAVSFSSSEISRVAGTAWTSGDKVGVYIIDSEGKVERSNICYVAAEGSAKQTFTLSDTEDVAMASFYPETGKTYNYYAYFPYDASLSDTDFISSIHISTNQENDMIDNNLLHASKEGVSGTVNDINFIFSHKFTNVYIGKSSDSDTNISLKKVRIVGTYTTGEFDVVSGEFTETVKGDIVLTESDSSNRLHLLTIPVSNLGGVYLELTADVTSADSSVSESIFYYVPTLSEWIAGVTHNIEIKLTTTNQ